MSHQPQVIPDPFEFARRGETLVGEINVCRLTRLADRVLDLGTSQLVRYELKGFWQDEGFFLDVQASATLSMQCQRCLGDVSCTVEADSRLLLVPRGTPLPDEGLEEDDFDPVHAGHDFDVLEAVEDELLLALPLAPTHDKCSVPVAEENGDDRSPFAVLRGFKTSGKRET